MECAWQPETLFMSAGSIPGLHERARVRRSGMACPGRVAPKPSAILTGAPGSPEGWRSFSMTSLDSGLPRAEGGWSNRKEGQTREISADKY